GEPVHGLGLGLTGDPERMTAGLGRVWTVDALTPALNELDTTSHSLETSINLPTSNEPRANGIAARLDPSSLAGGDGVIWLTSYVKGQLWRVDPSVGSVTATIPVGRGALGLAVDREGVWVANSLDGTVTRVDPHTNRA